MLRANEIQVMSAGAGVVHSEFNSSKTEPVHVLHIWIEPTSKGFVSNYQQLALAAADKLGAWRLLVSPPGSQGTAQLQQDTAVSVTELTPGEARPYTLRPDRHACIQVVSGQVLLNGNALKAGDAATVSEEQHLILSSAGESTSEVLLFDLA